MSEDCNANISLWNTTSAVTVESAFYSAPSMMDQVFCWDLENANTTTLAKTFYSYPGGFDSRCVPQGKRELITV